MAPIPEIHADGWLVRLDLAGSVLQREIAEVQHNGRRLVGLSL
jgi:hypothetical protein